MRSLLIVLSLASLVIAVPHDSSDSKNIFQRAKCNADNCLRAVTGTQPGQTQTRVDRKGDCSSFFQPTTTASATTVTVTFTAAPVFPHKREVENQIENRQALDAPFTVPAYASPCSGTVRYSSACSCFGVTATTVTAPAPTFTEAVNVPYPPFLAVFYSEPYFQGIRLIVDPSEAGNCVDVPAEFARQASSVWWGVGQQCYMYEFADCLGYFARVDKTGAGGTNDDFHRVTPPFYKRMTSYRCTLP
ncbi:hypothetical protein ONS95_013531 [Cadophora gregata]|uniref:uncharacterized protein n=1 Tax=Cadophora gregata TaxID=51156 RepID=UPI0026DBC616|nr:uncharacterized protein ONS95_013531 [Cadophora gregata]KAK0099572.1 hypothetical protein ONS96_008073 [Cadophora gregata f. sp. sojae]KAK0116518.1 hypothetical protein ONS95_013531 [Cadophora gregata]